MTSITDLPDVVNKLVLEFLADPDRLNKHDDIVFLYNLLFVNTRFTRIIVDTNNNNLCWILLSAWAAKKFFKAERFDDHSNLEGMVKSKAVLSKKIMGLNNTSKFYELLSFQIASINKSYLNLYAVRNNKKLMLALIWLDVNFFKEASVELKKKKDFMVKSASMYIDIASSFGGGATDLPEEDRIDLRVDSWVGYLSNRLWLPSYNDYLLVRIHLSGGGGGFGSRGMRIAVRLSELYGNAGINSPVRHAVVLVLSSMMLVRQIKDNSMGVSGLKYIEYDVKFLKYILGGNDSDRLQLVISVFDCPVNVRLRNSNYLNTRNFGSIAQKYIYIINHRYTISMNEDLIQLALIVSKVIMSVNSNDQLSCSGSLVDLLSSIMRPGVLTFYIQSKQLYGNGVIDDMDEFVAFIQPIVNLKGIHIKAIKNILMAMCHLWVPMEQLRTIYDVIPDNMLAVAMMYCSDGDSFNEWMFNRCSFADEVLLSSNTYSSNIMVRTCVYLLTKRLDCFDKLGDDYFGHIVVEAYKLMNGAEDDGDYSLSTILFDCFKDNEEKLKQLLSHKMEGRNVLLHIAFELSRDSSITVSSVSAFDNLIECVKDNLGDPLLDPLLSSVDDNGNDAWHYRSLAIDLVSPPCVCCC